MIDTVKVLRRLKGHLPTVIRNTPHSCLTDEHCCALHSAHNAAAEKVEEIIQGELEKAESDRSNWLERYRLGMLLVEKWAAEEKPLNQIKAVANYCLEPAAYFTEEDLVRWLKEKLEEP